MIYKVWDKSHFRYCRKCEAIYMPKQQEMTQQYAAGPVEEVEKCEECCPICPCCTKLFEKVAGIRKVQFQGVLTKSGELKLDEDAGEDDIMELCCSECGGKLPVEKYVKEVL